MFAHKIVESFSDILKRRGFNCDFYRRSMVNVNRAIRERAVGFYLGDAGMIDRAFHKYRKDAEGPSLFLGEAAVDVRPPYPHCLFMFRDIPGPLPEGRVSTSRRAVLTTELADDLIAAYVIAYYDELKLWLLSPQAYMISIGKPLHDNEKFLEMVPEDSALGRGKHYHVDVNGWQEGEEHNTNIQILSLATDISPDDRRQCTIDDARDLTVLNGSLLLLNCKNIETRTVEPSWKLNKKRAKAGRELMMAHRTLVIRLPKSRQKASDPGDGPSSMALHRCRGHFKTFTEDAPLFGSITGRFWWASHVRGSRTNGEVTKDYAIEAA